MRTYENICFCYGKITYQSALKSYFAQIVELVNKKSDPSNFQRFRNQDQFCLNNGLYPSRTYSKWSLHDCYQFYSKLISFFPFRLGDYLITSHGLYQAVRSYLHFSQLSAWYSSSRGQEPKNVLYRITIPGEAFASKFSCKPEEHYFPSASKSQIQKFIDFTVQNSPITCFLSAHRALAVCERLFLWLLFNTSSVLCLKVQ